MTVPRAAAVAALTATRRDTCPGTAPSPAAGGEADAVGVAGTVADAASAVGVVAAAVGVALAGGKALMEGKTRRLPLMMSRGICV